MRPLATAKVVLTLALSACSFAAAAQTTAPAPSSASPPPSTALKPGVPAPVIVVVDLQAVVQQTKAGQGIKQQHDKFLQSYETEIRTTRKELSDEEAELSRQKNTLSMPDWQKRAQAFDQRLSSFNQKFNKITQAVDKSYIAAMNELGRSITRVTSDVATEIGANLVLPKTQVILHDPLMDMTKNVIDRMDEKYPSVAFPPPELGPVESPTKPGKP